MLAVHRHDDDALEGVAQHAGADHRGENGETERGEIERKTIGLRPPERGPSTVRARYAPIAMKAPWPKLSTSIRPKTSVNPLEMTKIIMPMASAAIVSVTHVAGLPISGSAISAMAGTSSSGTMSASSAGSAREPPRPPGSSCQSWAMLRNSLSPYAGRGGRTRVANGAASLRMGMDLRLRGIPSEGREKCASGPVPACSARQPGSR